MIELIFAYSQLESYRERESALIFNQRVNLIHITYDRAKLVWKIQFEIISDVNYVDTFIEC